jgi:GNAT superfamily N-acetyltransferase
MSTTMPITIDGTTDVPRGMLATVVTFLEMHARPPMRPDPDLPTPGELVRLGPDEIERYLAIYRRLGHRWMWFSRLVMRREQVAAIIADPGTQAWCLTRDGEDIGLLELDFRQEGRCEIAFFGLVEKATGQGIGRWMMNRALKLAWSPPVSRVWVHTCTFDDPRAVAFYQRSGFEIFKIGIEICHDPRLAGHLPVDAAPHVPLLR